jgi:hypothetical protein
MPIQKRQFIINPLNATTDGFSHRDGNPVVKFSIPAQELFLETHTLHLSGLASFHWKGSSTAISTDGADNTLNVDTGTDLSGNPNILANSTALNLSNYGGIHNCIDKVVITSKKSSVELVNESNYSQFNALQQGFVFNNDDYLKKPLNRSLSSGNNADLVNRRLLITSDLTGTKAQDKGVNFSLKLNIPLLKLYPIHLGEDFVGGLTISIHLSPDSAVLCSRNRHTGTVSDNDPTGSFYKLKNLKLGGRYLIPDANDMKAYQSVLPYNNRVNFINDIHSSVNSSGYTPQLQFVKSIVNVFQRGDAVNNFKLNQNNFSQVVGLEKSTQSKNNMRFPYDFPVEAVPNNRSLDKAGVELVPNNLKFKSLGLGDTEQRLHFSRSVLGVSEPYHASVSLQMTEDNMREEYATAVNAGAGDNTKVDLAGVGADYSMGLGMVQNYVNQDYSVELHSGVNTNKANLPTDTKNIGLLQQTFVRNVEELDLKKLVKVM